jgi:penicillin-binding protein 2
VAVIGGVALVLFAIIFFRLWYLQVLSGDQYVAQANNNRVRDLPIPAPRGDVLDRNGQPLATDHLTNAVQIVPDQLPTNPRSRIALYRRLGNVLQMSAGDIGRRVAEQHKQLPYADVTIKTDAGSGVLGYLYERQQQFPGVTQQQVYLRTYPDKQLAAQVLGYVGQVGPTQLHQKRFRGVQQGTIVGQYGVELAYDRYLRGRTGAQRVQVNSLGQPTGSVTTYNPIQGHDLKLSVDFGLQHEGEVALQKGIGLAQANGHPASSGAFVALDPRNGEVLAMGSAPSFDPNVFARPLTQSQYDALVGTSTQTPGPLYNRAISGGYPTGSTFKPITALASLQSGLVTPDTALGGGQCISVGAAGQQFCNAGKADYGALPMVDALRVSSDTYFYTLGEEANSHGNIIQNMAHRLGLGRPTGIDLPGENGGVIPDRAWRAHQAQVEIACEKQKHVPSCGISDKRPWSVGDNVNFAVGQGDLEASPLQMAVAYSAIANGGTVVRPHLGVEIDDSTGRLIQRVTKPAVRHVALNPSDRTVVLDGLHAAASQAGGTSADVWTGWNQAQHPIFGKTGTAQHSNQDDQSWYICYAPDPVRPIVIAMTIEKGGFGAEAAAPAVRLMMSKWFHVAPKLVVGHSRTR